jgi:octaprenyl-diphosphate synthase
MNESELAKAAQSRAPTPQARSVSPVVDLANCFEPVAAELAALEDHLQGELVTRSAALRELVRHISRYSGKRLRPALVYLAAKACDRSVTPEHHRIAAIVELIHTATLIHDDILDGADVRRRVPTVNAKNGNHVAVLLGDFVYAHAFAMSVELSTPEASKVLARVTKIVCQGEIEQIFDRFDFDISEPRYLAIVEAKTAELYAAAAELGASYAGAERAQVEALATFGRCIGIAFQIIDDCLDLIGDEAVVGKSLGTDLESGKLTLPLLRLRDTASDGERQRLRAILLDDGLGDRRQLLADEFDLGPALDWSFQRADDFIRDAQAALEPLPANAAREALRAVADFVVCRKR